MALTTGSRIGAYEVTGSLGAGGMGEVYRATRTSRRSTASSAPVTARFDRRTFLPQTITGPDMRTLYVTAGKTLYKVRTENPGLPR